MTACNDIIHYVKLLENRIYFTAKVLFKNRSWASAYFDNNVICFYSQVLGKLCKVSEMNDIIEALENVKLDDQLQCKLISHSYKHLQKCYLSPKVISSFNLKPADIIMLDNPNWSIIAKAFIKYDICEHVVKTCPTVKINKYSDFDLNANSSVVSLEKLIKPQLFQDLEIDIIFDTLECLLAWDRKIAELIYVLKRRILKNLIFKTECELQLDPLTSHELLKINTIIVVGSSYSGIGTVGSKTKLKVRNMLTLTQHEQKKKNTTQVNLFGLDRILKKITDIIDYNIIFRNIKNRSIIPPTKQLLIAGPAGCGKTSLVKLVGQKRKCTVMRILAQNLYSKDPGESEAALRNIFEESFHYAASEGTCIIHLDDIDVLCPNRKTNSSHVARLSTQLLHLLDKAQDVPGIIVIGTTSNPSFLDASLRRQGRLSTEFSIGIPMENERSSIIFNFLRLLGCTWKDDMLIKLCTLVAQITQGYVGADLKNVCQTVALGLLESSILTDTPKNVDSVFDKFKMVLTKMKPASLRTGVEVIPKNNGNMDQIGGMYDVKKEIDMAINWPLLYPKSFKRLGIAPFKGILLYGPPGCAKTSLVRALADRGNYTIFTVTSAQIYSPYVGDAEKAIVSLFDKARQNTPAIIFFDEIDSIFGSRTAGDNSQNQERVLAALLTEIDGVGSEMSVADTDVDMEINGKNVIVIGATNRPTEIDAALLRPGRLDKHIYVPRPDEQSRLDILKILFRHTPISKDVSFDKLAAATDYCSGADLKNFHTEVVLLAMKEEGVDVKCINNIYFDTVLQTLKPSLTPDS